MKGFHYFPGYYGEERQNSREVFYPWHRPGKLILPSGAEKSVMAKQKGHIDRYQRHKRKKVLGQRMRDLEALQTLSKVEKQHISNRETRGKQWAGPTKVSFVSPEGRIALVPSKWSQGKDGGRKGSRTDKIPACRGKLVRLHGNITRGVHRGCASEEQEERGGDPARVHYYTNSSRGDLN